MAAAFPPSLPPPPPTNTPLLSAIVALCLSVVLCINEILWRKVAPISMLGVESPHPVELNKIWKQSCFISHTFFLILSET